jgi:hypothetical protein
MPGFLVVICVLSVLLLIVWGKLREAQRVKFIRHYHFPRGLIAKLQAHHPGLAAQDGQVVAQALRQFFLAHLLSGKQFVSMPSRITDDFWREFTLCTNQYQVFCKQAFGRVMPHTPAVALGTEKRDNAGLRRAWWHCCKDQNIDPRVATHLPLLFAIDAKLGIANGFKYVPDTAALRDRGTGVSYSAADFGSSRFDGGTDGFGDGGSGDGGSGDGGGGD